MKVDRCRRLFYQLPIWRRPSNLYRLFGLMIFILAGGWFTLQLDTGTIHNPFEPTPTSTRTINSLALEGDAQFQAGALDLAINAYQQATAQDSTGDPQVCTELARIQAYSSELLSNDADRLARLTEALQSANQAVAIAPGNSDAYAIRAFVLDWNADTALDPAHRQQKSCRFHLSGPAHAVQALSLNSQNPLSRWLITLKS